MDPSNLVGSRLGRFEIVDRLGAGGMGVVYRAVDPELRRPVAIKVLPGLSHDTARRQRFLREARLAAAVQHPNIAQVYEIGEEQGLPYLVMELLQGESLRALIERSGRLPLLRAVELAATLASAAERAHAVGVVHRDLKPDNLVLDASGALKVLDFGIAKPLDDSEPVLTNDVVTAQGAVMGTPGYMAPEQACGGVIDGRTDVFSIGVVLYEMLTGRVPFGGNTGMERILATLRESPPSPSSLGFSVPPEVERVLAFCLAKEPAARYPDARTLAADLAQVAAGLGARAISAPPAPFAPVVAGVMTPATVRLPAALAPTELGVPTPGAVSFGAASPPARPRRLWPLFAGLALMMVGALGVVAWFVVVPHLAARSAASTLAALRQPAVGLDALRRYREPKDATASQLATVPFWATAARDFEQASAQPGAPPLWHAAELFTRAEAAELEGDLDLAERGFRDALTAKPDWSLPHVGLAEVGLRRRQASQALRAAQDAEIAEPGLWLAKVVAARAYVLDGQPQRAAQEFRAALQAAPGTPALLGELALAYHGARMDDEAMRTAREALEGDPELYAPHVLLAERALETGDDKLALFHATRATAAAPENVAAWLAKGDALLALGRGADAQIALAEAVRLWKKTKQAGAPDARLRVVDAALGKGALPPPRVAPPAPGRSGAPAGISVGAGNRTGSNPTRTQIASPPEDRHGGLPTVHPPRTTTGGNGSL